MSAPGRWLELRARRSNGPEEDDGELAQALVELGGRAVEERDGWLITHLPEPVDPDAFVHEVTPFLSRWLGEPVTVVHGWRTAEDWAETWKRGLGPRRITHRLWVTPSWERVEAGTDAVVVVVDPGMAFGTAEHATTRGALRLLDRTLHPGERVVDVGAGSGILAIAAALLGAAEVVAVEGDPVAAPYGRENLGRNGVAARVRWLESRADAALLRGLGPVDGFLANLESGVLLRLLPGLWDGVRPGGWLILSGITGEEWEGFAHDVTCAGLSLEAMDLEDEWCSGHFSRPPGLGSRRPRRG